MAKRKDKRFRPYYKQRLPPHRYECLFCQSAFRWNRDLEAHMNCHTNERPHFCEKCSASFPNPSNLGVHRKFVHEKKIFKCDFCGQIYKSLGLLCCHRRVKHKVKPRKGEKKIVTPKSCTIYQDDINSSILIHRKRSRLDRTIKNEEVTKKSKGRPPRFKPSDPVDVKVNSPRAPKIKIEAEEESPLPSPPPDQKVTSKSPPCLKKRLITRFNKDDFCGRSVNEHSDYCGYPIPPVPQITIPPEIPIDLVPFYAVLNISDLRNRSKNSEWDPSFFLHMNRYDPDQDIKREKEIELNEQLKVKRGRGRRGGPRMVEVKREVLKGRQMGGGGGFGSIKRGRPRKDSDEQDVVVKVEAKDMIDVKDWEVLDGGQKAKCPYCERIMFKANLHSHVLVHTGEKPWKCKFCEKKFRQKSHLIKHIIRYHRYGHAIGKPGVRKTPELLKEAEENLDCAFCGNKFNDKWNLEQHLLRIHNDEYRER